VNNINTIKNKLHDDKKKFVDEWVGNNLPNTGDLTSDYYNKYKSECDKNLQLTIQKFTKCVTDFGYYKLHEKKELLEKIIN